MLRPGGWVRSFAAAVAASAGGGRPGLSAPAVAGHVVAATSRKPGLSCLAAAGAARVVPDWGPLLGGGGG